MCCITKCYRADDVADEISYTGQGLFPIPRNIKFPVCIKYQIFSCALNIKFPVLFSCALNIKFPVLFSCALNIKFPVLFSCALNIKFTMLFSCALNIKLTVLFSNTRIATLLYKLYYSPCNSVYTT